MLITLKGFIRADFDPATIANLSALCGCYSVLTDEKYFLRALIIYIKSASGYQPVVKNFIIDDTNLFSAFFYQADAHLLMLPVLDDERYRALSAIAHQLNMGVLTE